jgi:hypothetical protein
LTLVFAETWGEIKNRLCIDVANVANYKNSKWRRKPVKQCLLYLSKIELVCHIFTFS